MSVISVKSMIVSAAMGLAAVFSAGVSANAAPANMSPGFQSGSGYAVTQVDSRNSRHRYAPACTTNQAAARAARMGYRNTRVFHRGDRLVVRGTRHGRPATVVFSARPGCPIIR